jgi:hypothetical protein
MSALPPKAAKHSRRSRTPLCAISGITQRSKFRANSINETRGQCSVPAGSRTVNSEPLPGSLATVTSPPIRSVMGHGRMVFGGRPEDFRANETVRRSWLEV